MDFETRAIHDGQEPDPATGAITTPIYQTSTYVQDAVGEHKGYDYSRVANPTRARARDVRSPRSRRRSTASRSPPGSARRRRSCTSLNPGDRVVLIADVYGGVYRMTSQVYEPKGYRFDYLPAEEFANLAEHLDESTRMVWVETPSNPLLNVVDIARRRRGRARGRRAARRRQHVRDAVPAAAARARRRRRRPLDDQVPRRPLRRRRRLRGDERPDRSPSACASCRSRSAPCPGRSTRWLVLRGIKTLALRMRQHCENAMAVAAVLERHSRVEQRLLPGAAVASRPRDRGAPDARLRRHGLVPRRVAGGGARRSSRARSSSGSPSRSAASRA